MKADRKSAKPDWQFDGRTIIVRIPMTFVRRGGRKAIVAPDGGDAWPLARPSPDEALIRAVVRAHRWRRLLDKGKYSSASELAEAEGVTRSFLNRLLRLTLLAPDIVEAVLNGRQPKGLQLKEMTRLLPSKWDEQRQRLISGFGLREPGFAGRASEGSVRCSRTRCGSAQPPDLPSCGS